MCGSTGRRVVGPAETTRRGTISPVPATPHDLVESLIRLAEAVEGLDLRAADVLGHQDVAINRDRISGAVRDYLIPRLEQPEAPLVVVFAGPTGSGKSTLVNSLTGLDLTVAGAIRPTTARPLVLAGDLAHGEAAKGDGEAQVVVGGAPVLEHMTFVDTPDIDSTSTQHRVIAESFIDRADIVIFVVSASRYADAVPWEILRRATSRGATVIPVVNRLGPGGGAVVTDFGARLRAAGLDVTPVRVPEHHLPAGAQHVPSPAVRELQRRLFKVAKQQRDHQAEVTGRVLTNTVTQARALADRIHRIGEEVTARVDAIGRAFAAAPTIEPDPERQWARARPPRLIDRLRGADDDWEARVVDGLSVEMEGLLRADIARHAMPAVEAAGGMTGALVRVSPMLEGAVDSWLRFASRIAEATGVSHRELVASVLADDVDADRSEAVERARSDLENRLAVVWQHVGVILAEGWKITVGDPDPGDLRERAAAVAAAQHLVDA